MGICGQCGKRKDTLYFDEPTGRWNICDDCCSPVFVRGEEVEVSNDYEWQKRIYLATIEGTVRPYKCVVVSEEELYRQGNKVQEGSRKYIRKLPQVQEAGPKKFTKETIEKYCEVYSEEGNEKGVIIRFLRRHGLLE